MVCSVCWMGSGAFHCTRLASCAHDSLFTVTRGIWIHAGESALTVVSSCLRPCTRNPRPCRGVDDEGNVGQMQPDVLSAFSLSLSLSRPSSLLRDTITHLRSTGVSILTNSSGAPAEGWTLRPSECAGSRIDDRWMQSGEYEVAEARFFQHENTSLSKADAWERLWRR